MADKKVPVKSAATRKRRTATSGGAPAKARKKKAGNPGYAGYEYQIDVTIWVALDLLLVKHATDYVVIEPRSDEDIEAAVRDPATALLGLATEGQQLDLVLQAKTLSGAPWTTPKIADVLLGKDAGGASSKRKRSRPLEMLQAEPKRRYIFITNEASAAALRDHEGEHLFDFPEVDMLPPHARKGFDEKAQASLSPRILLLTGVTEEVLSSRITGLLELHGHVPKPKHDVCVRDLRDEVRRRIKGEEDGHWTRQELLNVLVRHGGSLTPTRDMDRYVRPRSFDKIKKQLDGEHAVVIAGPSGTGKTLTADILEFELRLGDPPFDVVGEENGPGHIRHHLLRSDPVLFHLRDPWGGNRLAPGADRWSGEVPKLLESAGPGRKFLITSRSDVLHSAGHELIKDLRPFIVTIEVDDYGPARLAEIYDGIAGDLTGHAHSLSQLYRERALKELARPYEVKRFLVALSREGADNPRKVEEIVSDSQIDAISRVIADQITPFGLDGVQSAAVIWAMLSARGAVSRDVFPKLVRRLRTEEPSLRPDVEGLIDFLVAGQNLRMDGAALAFYHPRVEDGLRLTFMRLAREAEFTLGKIVNVLVAWDGPGADWGVETGLGVLRAATKIENLSLELAAPTQVRLDGYLESVALAAGKRHDFERALRDLIRFGSADHMPSQLARLLIEGRVETEAHVFRDRWRALQLDESEKAALRVDQRTKLLIDRFIREVLPFSHRNYHLEAVSLLGELASDLQQAYWDALNTIAGPGGPNENIDVIVAGALSGEAPDYDRAIERFARSEAETEAWMEGFAEDAYKAEEHAVDADVADRDVEEPSEQYHNAREGMKTVVRLRRACDGVDWISQHVHSRLLLYALSDLIGSTRRKPEFAELQLLLDAADGWVRDHAWWAVQQHWDGGLSDFLTAELVRSDIEQTSLRRRLIEITAANTVGGDLVDQLAAVAGKVSSERRLELVQDVVTTSLDGDPKGKLGLAARRSRAEKLTGSFAEPERALACALIGALAGDKIRVAASSLPAEARPLLGTILPSSSNDVAGTLVCLAAAAGLDIDTTVDRLLATDDAQDGAVAVQALLIENGVNLTAGLRAGLKHKRYYVRREALRELVLVAKPEERDSLVLLAKDHSADVRLAFARLMQEHRWPEAIHSLVELLEDNRNFSRRFATNSSWSKFSVARAAANALEAYETLPEHALDALVRCAAADSDDPFVVCAVLSALAKRGDDRVSPVLIAALESTGLDGASLCRPRAQAAAWALFDRTVEQKLSTLGLEVARVAAQDTSVVAGPLLVAIGIQGGGERKAFLDRMHRDAIRDREELVRTAAIAANNLGDMVLSDREEVLSRLTHGREEAVLTPSERAMIESWSQNLNLESGIERFTAWIAEILLKLPISGEIGDIRTFDLPEHIPVMTMRSFTQHAEEENGIDDGS